MHEQDYDQIQVQVSTEYVPDQSSAEAGRYVFAYHVTIENHGKLPAQLLSRHWIITDGNQQVQEVRGEGVIGEKPTIMPGEAYQYSSGTVLQTPVGSMQGSYQMIDATGLKFDADIPVFTLATPRSLH
ncbi:Co2+/Mg2+ efflux protein ApaG [Ketobacter sp. MCCC 1A13808]|uniref:Co2+/Mg2+ efflux protein ApaG n=1 Tax=Ketobacter sp. MCCC 1A13808 TaxID=2602738 RepID=UPI000F1B25A8|nr:Co2+/Mg2+ efflux protein ApaG [Ketobacter sp. MCCC 1A13808]MVF13098.1 Co2+/Mg2+ efflux protein ApaG [Ketobacter sp. MCCC 1A13808]RLP52994.1 MAG: Co2+/Mg2+ efflux protein ApaG [Ketobacter sp.]